MSDTPPQHPVSHVDPDKRYGWMKAECAALDAARQAREDGLIGTITQLSSAALLVIPGLLLGSDEGVPNAGDAPLLMAGILLFLVALILAMLEQYLSGHAYRRQREIVQDYYLLESEKSHDDRFDRWVRLARNSACVTFALAVLLAAAGLFDLDRTPHGNASTATATATSPATTASATTASTTASTTATATSPATTASATTPTPGAENQLRGRSSQEVESRSNRSTTADR